MKSNHEHTSWFVFNASLAHFLKAIFPSPRQKRCPCLVSEVFIKFSCKFKDAFMPGLSCLQATCNFSWYLPSIPYFVAPCECAGASASTFSVHQMCGSSLKPDFSQAVLVALDSAVQAKILRRQQCIDNLEMWI